MARVLIVDDDRALLRALRVVLASSSYEIVTTTTGEQGISEAALAAPDVIVLDLGLPDIDGIVVCRRIREWSDVPIIVLSAADAERRKVAALDAGADDYVTKPFGTAELEARIRTALRHRQATAPAKEPTALTVGSMDIDLVRREARLRGGLVKLTAREFDLLAYLAKNHDRVCTHQMILEAVWGSPYAKETQYLHSYIHRIRQKLRTSDVQIDTAPGIGYVLTVSPS